MFFHYSCGYVRSEQFICMSLLSFAESDFEDWRLILNRECALLLTIQREASCILHTQRTIEELQKHSRALKSLLYLHPLTTLHEDHQMLVPTSITRCPLGVSNQVSVMLFPWTLNRGHCLYMIVVANSLLSERSHLVSMHKFLVQRTDGVPFLQADMTFLCLQCIIQVQRKVTKSGLVTSYQMVPN
jgi:hypothetical protein